MNAQGVFYQLPYGPRDSPSLRRPGRRADRRAQLPPLSVTLFNPSYDKDKFENTSLTVDGKIGDLKLVYAGGYLVRNIEQQQDYTNYARGVYGYYYQCAGYSKSESPAAGGGQCFSPRATWQDTEKNTHQSHEFRVSTPDDWRMRGIGGLYWEEFKIYDDTDWMYKTVPTCSATYNNGCFNNVQPWPDSTANVQGERNDNVGFFDDISAPSFNGARSARSTSTSSRRPLILTAGTRYYQFDESELGGRCGQLLLQASRRPPTSVLAPRRPTATASRRLTRNNPGSARTAPT